MKLIQRNKVDLLTQLVKTSFKMRYQNSVLGFLWVLIKPYATFTVLFLIWSSFRNNSIENFALYLLVGIVLYTYFNELIILGQMSLLDSAHIILKVNFPRQIAILSALIGGVINLGINLLLVIIIIFFINIDSNPSNNIKLSLLGIGYFLFIALIVFMMTLGIALFTSIFTIKFRDLRNIFELSLFLLYWATPIFYDPQIDLPEGRLRDVLMLNPMGFIINQARAALGVRGVVNWELMVGCFFISIIVLALGWIYFHRKVKYVAEYF